MDLERILFWIAIAFCLIFLANLGRTALSSALLIAPVSYHRVLFQQRRKPHLVRSADRLAKSGLVFLALAGPAIARVLAAGGEAKPPAAVPAQA